MERRITFINHATLLIQLGGISFLTDPIYSRSISFMFFRRQKPGIPFSDLPPIDFILISHSDYDHLNMKTLRRLGKREETALIVPRGVGIYGARAGFRNVIEMSPWEEFSKDGVSIVCTPAKHRSKRRPGDPTATACAGFIIGAGDRKVYFAGDTAYAEFFGQIGAGHKIDVALLPIGAYKPEKWFKDQHLHPATAVQAFQDLRASHLVPYHWGTFWISDEPMEEPPQKLQEKAKEQGIQDKVHILRNGDVFRF